MCAAGLDVLPVEPLNRDHPLIAAWTSREPRLEGRLQIAPHAAFYTPESLTDLRRLAMRSAVDFLAHGTLRSCVNLRQLQVAGYFLDERARY